ncbi:MAG: PSD1 and planctomycete cytochrome C domain-containing protein [Bryobacteraceae bacterium]
MVNYSLIFIVFYGSIATALSAAGDGSDPPRFESHILPILQARCTPCHDEKVKQAGLLVTDRDQLIKGGKTGAALVPGKPVESLLLSVVSSGKMPLGGKKLTGSEIDLIRSWIEAGALRRGETATARTVTESEALTSILGAKCFVCHGRRTRQAGLDLRTRASILKGGKSGPALVLGKPEESLIVKRIVTQSMPPPNLQEQFSVRGVTSDELERLQLWIAAGAPQDTEKPLDVHAQADPLVTDKDRTFWSFRPPLRPAIPSVRPQDRVRNPIDAFLLEKLEAKGISFNEDADRRTLLRRAYFDLTGLPPSPAEIDAFLKDTDPNAYERLVDRLLDSPHYGERWARFWLEGVGYSDSEGGTSADEPRPHAWRYRDYVIRSFNSDKPYDRFLTEQIAGDEMFDYRAEKEYTPEQIDLLAATGFWRMGPDSTYSTEQNFLPDRLDVIAGQIEIFGSSVVGLSIGCARCHDHKYDPIQTRIEELEKDIERMTAEYRQKLEAERIEKLPAEVREDARTAVATPEAKRSDVQKFLIERFETALAILPRELEEKFPEYRQKKLGAGKQLAAEKEKLKLDPKLRALFDLGAEPPPTRVLLRGEYTNPGPLVEPGVPSVLHTGLSPYKIEKPLFESQTSGRRLALARWLVQPNHPLTARVMVNRVWQQHFGTGLASTPGNFGRMGSPPSHDRLLDWLATEFVDRRWSIKTLHRLIMTSTAYRQSARFDGDRHAQDSDGALLSRFPVRRLDSDALRDAILRVSGRLDLAAFGPPVPIKVMPDGEVVPEASARGERRSIYLLNRRTRPITALETFDAPFLNPNCLKRAQSVVSSQALQLMNSDLARESSRYMAGRIIDAVGGDPKAQIETVYATSLARKPSAEELRLAQNALEAMSREWLNKLEAEKPAEPVQTRAHWLALATLCHTVMNSAEFVYID